MGNRPLRLGEARSVALQGRVEGRWVAEHRVKAEALTPDRWRARAPVGTQTGTRVLEGSGPSRARARAALAANIDALALAAPDPDATLETYVLRWLARLDEEGLRSPGTRATYRNAATVCVIPARGDWRVTALTEQAVSGYLREEHDVRPGRVPTIRVVLRAALDMAIQDGVIPAPNPVTAAVRFAKARPAPVEHSLSELTALIEAAREYDRRPRTNGLMADALLVLAGTGVRAGEVLALRTEDWDRSAGVLTISGTVKDEPRIHRQPHPKTISGWRRLTAPAFVAEVLDRRATGGLLFQARGGAGPVSPANFRRALRDIAPAGMTPKALRRITAALLAGEDLDAAALQLGHSGVGTLRHYASARPLADNAALLQALDPDAAAKAQAWAAVQALAAAFSVGMVDSGLPAWRGELTAWGDPKVGPNFEAAVAGLAARWPELQLTVAWSEPHF